MNTIHAPQRLPGPPEQLRITLPPRRTSPLDRAAMHLGLRLLIWSTRLQPQAPDRETQSRRFSELRDRESRESAYARRHDLCTPRL